MEMTVKNARYSPGVMRRASCPLINTTNYINADDMNAKEFFYLVAEMRSAQQAYFETKDRKVFRAARALENEVDREIRRVREIVNREPSTN